MPTSHSVSAVQYYQVKVMVSKIIKNALMNIESEEVLSTLHIQSSKLSGQKGALRRDRTQPPIVAAPLPPGVTKFPNSNDLSCIGAHTSLRLPNHEDDTESVARFTKPIPAMIPYSLQASWPLTDAQTNEHRAMGRW